MGNIYLIRHGETYWNKLGIMHGQMDIPLNETGKNQAMSIALQLKDINFDVCFCSPLQRAMYTAKEILKFHTNVPIFHDDRLMEIYKGLFEGTHNDSELIMKNENFELLSTYNIESKAHFFKRVKEFYDEILPLYKDKDILVVSHSGTVKMSMFYFNPPKNCIIDEWYNIHIKNCELYTVENKVPNGLPILKEYDVDKEKYPLI